jgi:hypothetical protein
MSVADLLRQAGRKVTVIDETKDAGVVADELLRAAQIAKPEFQPFPKLARLSREMTITEKIDGTNAQVFVTEEGQVFAGSRTRWVTPENDNYGFAAWVKLRMPRSCASSAPAPISASGGGVASRGTTGSRSAASRSSTRTNGATRSRARPAATSCRCSGPGVLQHRGRRPGPRGAGPIREASRRQAS